MSSKKVKIVVRNGSRKKKGRGKKRGVRHFKEMSSRISRITLPSARSRMVHGPGTTEYGAAPYHDQFGSGMRLTIRGVKVCDITGMFGQNDCNIFPAVQNGVSYYASALSPTVYESYLSGTSTANTTNMWGCNNVNINAVGTQLALFSVMSVRKLVVEFDSTTATTVSGQLVLAAIFPLGGKREAADKYEYLEKVVVTPLWKGASLVVVSDKEMHKPSMVTYPTCDEDFNADNHDTPFYIVGKLKPQLPTGGPTPMGTLRIKECVIDVYKRGGSITSPTTASSLVSNSVSELSTSSCSTSMSCPSSVSDSKLSVDESEELKKWFKLGREEKESKEDCEKTKEKDKEKGKEVVKEKPKSLNQTRGGL